MIKGATCETVTVDYAVTGEGPVDRPHSSTKIVAVRLTVTWERTTEYGWRVHRMEVAGYRAKADGTAGGQALYEHWYTWHHKDGSVTWSSDTQPPLWATLVAANRCPIGGPLDALTEPTEALDLDQVR
jgi:hypothetical protein